MRIRRNRSSRSKVAAALSALLLLAGMSCQGEPTDSDSDFFAALELRSDYQYFATLRELWEITDVTVVGEIVGVQDGRTIGGQARERGTISTVLLQVEVHDVVSGTLAEDSERLLDVEVFRPDLAAPEDLAADAPEQPVLLMLQDVAAQPQPREVDDSRVDRDPAKTLYTIPTPKALFVERDGGVVTPLDPQPGPYEDSIKAQTIEELVEEVRAF